VGLCRNRPGLVNQENCGSLCRSSAKGVALAGGLKRHPPRAIPRMGQGLRPIVDGRNCCQPTSMALITQAFTSYINLKGNAGTERMMRTMKEVSVWIRE
jgi:hypothetical protein